jgi:hypothetical protein
MISLPFMYGFVCNWWRKIIDCMLEKKPGVRKIHIMRIICLFEADFNTLLKWMFNQHIMPNAEKSGLSPDQWGGRNNWSAPACALRKLLAWEYARFAKTILVSFLADLQSNFDCLARHVIYFFNEERHVKSGRTLQSSHYGNSRPKCENSHWHLNRNISTWLWHAITPRRRPRKSR